MRFPKVLGLLFIFSFTFVHSVSTQDEIIIFVGHPKVRLIGSALDTHGPEEVLKEEVVEFRCEITKRGDKYYWTSRDDYKMEKVLVGLGYIEFHRVDPADYVRITTPAIRGEPIVGKIVPGHLPEYDYTEHITFGLSSVNYWGKVIYEVP